MPIAYQDQDGKWWKQCSSTKQLFGPVDNKEYLSEWFCKHKRKSDGFNTQCKSVHNENNKKYNSLNKEKVKQYKQTEKMKEWKRGYNKQYLLNNKNIVYECQRKWRKENPLAVQEKNKKYCVNNQDKILEYRKSAKRLYAKYKYSAKKRGIDFTLTLEWFEEQIKLEEYNTCAVSGMEFVDGLNHPFSRSLDRVNNSRGYSPDNVKWVCFKYNSWKSDLSLEEINMIAEYVNKNVNQPLTV